MIKTDEERVKALFKELVEFYKKNRYLFPKEDGVKKNANLRAVGGHGQDFSK